MDEGEESSASHQIYPADVTLAPVTPAKVGQSDPNIISKNWVNMDEAVIEETSAKSFSCSEGNLGSTSQNIDLNSGMFNGFIMDDVDTWNSISCMNLLAMADSTIKKGSANGVGGGSSGGGGGVELNMQLGSDVYSVSNSTDTQQYGRLNLNLPPQTIAEIETHINTGLSLQFTPVTPDQATRRENTQVASDKITSNENGNGNEKTNLDASTIVESNEDVEKGLTEQTNLNETPQQKQRRRKHRPKVVREGKPKRVRKPPTPKPDGSTGKRKYVRRKGVEKSKSTETPTVEGASVIIDLTTEDQEPKKSVKRKIDFDEVEKSGQTVVESQSPSPITPNKTELPQGRSSQNQTNRKAKCKLNFVQETFGKGQSSVNESNCSASVCFNKGGGSSTIDGMEVLYESVLGASRESMEAYLSIFTDFNSGMNVPTTYKKKRVEKHQTSNINFDFSAEQNACKASEMLKGKGVKDDAQAFSHLQNFKKRTKSSVQVHDMAGMVDGRQLQTPKGGSRNEVPRQQYTHMEAHAAGLQVSIGAKKRTKKSSVVSSLYNGQSGNYPNIRHQSIYGIDALIHQFKELSINSRIMAKDKNTLTEYSPSYHDNNALVVYQQSGTLVPYEGLFNPIRKRKPRPKVDLDDETDRVWRLLLEDINSQGVDGTDEDKAKWWEEERRVFRGRADSFIARMHLVQGDRRFSRWKGSVLDSVVGVFLTQNVSDHLSSSAFMSLASRFPLKSESSSSEPLQEETPSMTVEEPVEQDESGDHDPMMMQNTVSCEEKEAGNSNELSKSSAYTVDLNDNSVVDQIEVDDMVSSQNSPSSVQSSIINTTEKLESCTIVNSEEKQKEINKANNVLGGCTSFVELLHMQGTTTVHETNESLIQKKNEKECVSEESGLSAESASQVMVQTVETTKVTESNKVVEASGETVQKVVEFRYQDKVRQEKSGKKQIEWDKLRLQADVKEIRKKTAVTMDSLDYEAVRNADVNDVADAIKERGMNNVLAARIKAVLDRLVKDHGSIDLEWLRDVPPDKAKEYLLSFRGLGLKSVECIRLLTLHHLAFPVDTNVGRIAVRLGWVPLQPLPESLQLHLLELYPILESIQKYLWPRLCKLDQRTLYELHYQMITFGKVFCTKSKPNCNACPMRGECRHFASAFASARLSLPAPEESMASLTGNITGQTPIKMIDQNHQPVPPAGEQLQQLAEFQNHQTVPPAGEQLQQLSEFQNHQTVPPAGKEPQLAEFPNHQTEPPAGEQLAEFKYCNPVIEEPATPEPIIEVPASPEPEQIQQEPDMEDFCEDTEEIPMIRLNIEEFTHNLQTYMEKHMELGEGDMSKALVALTSEAAAIPTPKLKNVSQLRTEHQVYELPDSHPLLQGLDTREPDDPCSYLLAIWTPGETADSIQPPVGQCSSQELGTLCNKETCFYCNSTREANAQTVRGTLLIPCRTAMRGSFPLNGTYFQVNEVFADHESSLNPIDVPRSWLWNLPRRTVYFGTSVPTIFKGLTTEDIQHCFWRGFVCVRGFDQKTRAPRPLMARLHFPASRLKKAQAKE